MKTIKIFFAFLCIIVMLTCISPMAVFAADTLYQVSSADTLANACSSLKSGDTIELMNNIDYTDCITVNSKIITLNLNGHNLNVSSSSYGLNVTNGELVLTGDGEFNVTGTTCGVQVSDGSATVTNAKGDGDNTRGAYAKTQGTIIVRGDATADGASCKAACSDHEGTVTVGGNASVVGDNSYGIYAQSGTVTVKGNATAKGSRSYGIYALEDGEVTADGNATAEGDEGYGICASSATVTLKGDATGKGISSRGAVAVDGGTVIVDGNALAVGDNGYGIYAYDAKITVNGNATGTGLASCGVIAGENNGTAIVHGNALAEGDDNSYGICAQSGGTVIVDGNASAVGDNGDCGIYAYSSTVTVNGDIFAAGSMSRGIFNFASTVKLLGSIITKGPDSVGAYAKNNGNITIDGKITAPSYIKLQDKIKTAAYGVAGKDSDLGYTIYSEDTGTYLNTIRVKTPKVVYVPSSTGNDSSTSKDSSTGNTINTGTEPYIKVIEIPYWIEKADLINVEANDGTFDQPVEVRIKDDPQAKKVVEQAIKGEIPGIYESTQIFPLDISIYIKESDTKVQPSNGNTVEITCPIPAGLLDSKEKLVVVCVIDGKLTVLPTTLLNKDGVWCAVFRASHFSPYAFIVDSDQKLSNLSAGEGVRDNSIPLPKDGTPYMIAAVVLTAGMIVLKRKKAK